MLLTCSPTDAPAPVPRRGARPAGAPRGKRRRARELPPGTTSLTCIWCKQALPLDLFAPSAVPCGVYRCRPCDSERRKRDYRQKPHAWVASEARAREAKRLGCEAAEVSFAADDALAVLERHGRRCALTGAEEKHVTVIVLDPTVPMSALNALPVTRELATVINGRLSTGQRQALLAGAGAGQKAGAEAEKQQAPGRGDSGIADA